MSIKNIPNITRVSFRYLLIFQDIILSDTLIENLIIGSHLYDMNDENQFKEKILKYWYLGEVKPFTQIRFSKYCVQGLMHKIQE